MREPNKNIEDLIITPILLKTEDASEFCEVETGELGITESVIVRGGEGYTPNHLYLVSNREVNGINWYYHTELKNVFQCTKSDKNFAGDRLLLVEFTTDPKLTSGWIMDNDPERKSTHTDITTMKGVPRIPKKAFAINEIFDKIAGRNKQEVHFVPYFVLSYNKRKEEWMKENPPFSGHSEKQKDMEMQCEMEEVVTKDYSGAPYAIRTRIKFVNGEPIIHFND